MLSFDWNGKNSRDFGIWVLEPPDLSFAAERVNAQPIPGRAGELIFREGADVYDSMTLSMKLWLPDGSAAATVGDWLRGSGELRVGNRPDGHYKARVSNQIDLKKVSRKGADLNFTVNFRCDPFFYHDAPPDLVLTEAGNVENPGNVAARPAISVKGTGGEVVLMVGEQIVTLNIPSAGAECVIDSDMEECYSVEGGAYVNRNGIMAGDFPRLLPGVNPVSWSGGVESVTIRPRWRSR